jgi:hypothetical protein
MRTAASGHKDQLLPPMLSARSEIRKGTVGTQGSWVMRRLRLSARLRPLRVKYYPRDPKPLGDIY